MLLSLRSVVYMIRKVAVRPGPRPHKDEGPDPAGATRPRGLAAERAHAQDDGPDRTEAALGKALGRLAGVKRRWDPDNVFRTTATSSRSE